MIGKLCSGSWGGAIFPPDEEIAIEGAMKIKPNINKNSGGLILRFLIRLTIPEVSGLFTTILLMSCE
jgi:hypothetical protein